MERAGFLDERRLLLGPWQAFERAVARLLLANGFEEVRVVGSVGDHGGDVLGVSKGKLWVVQCKHTTLSSPPKEAVAEIVEAARFYRADKMMIASSRPPSEAFLEEKAMYERRGLRIEIAEPATLLSLMGRTPIFPPARKELRAYQEDAAFRFRNGLLETGRAQIVLATGLGKTLVMADTISDLLEDGLVRGGRALILAHTKELVDQLERSFWSQLPKWVPTHRLCDGEMPTFWDGITFATVQSAKSQLALLPHFGLLLVDEAHHIGAEIFRQTIEELRPEMLGGVTATPWRGDGYDIDQILGPSLVRIGIADGLAKGFLADVDYRLLADNIDWKFVQEASRNRYSISQLNRQLIIPTRDEKAARMIRELFDRTKRRGGIVFSPTIVHAREFAAMLRHFGFRAEAISSDVPPRERDILMSRFRAGDYDFLATVDLFNEGVDVPDVDIIVFMRVTHSRRIFVQQLGRGLRVSPGKDKVLVLDFVTDLRRLAEVVELDSAVRMESVERLGLGGALIEFSDRSVGNFLREWLLDQASLFAREDDPEIELPQFEFPTPPPPGGVQ
jgi:superfamily II DNA or RNA helicase